MGGFIPLLLVLIVVAALLQEDSVLVVFYLLAGVYLTGLWWSRNAFKHVTFERSFVSRAFLNQVVPITLRLANKGWLPVVWLKIHESLPVDLISPNFIRSVVTLGPRGKAEVEYHVLARKRGYYKIGPLFLDFGDLLGLTRQSASQVLADNLIVYPKIVALPRLGLPSNSPFGTQREQRPIFEDPTRVRGKRDYVSGDSLRRVDWKTTASVGRLQVKCFEPSIALETCLILNLDLTDYEQKHAASASELAIVTAASLANWVVDKKGHVGFSTNGIDPLSENDSSPQPLPPRRGPGSLMQILDVLARIQTSDTYSCMELLGKASAGLAWGTTIILVTSLYDITLLEELFQLQRRGLNVILVVVGMLPNQQELHRQAQHFDIPVYPVYSEIDLEVWHSSQ